MNNKHRRTLIKIFERPTRSDLRWPDIIALFETLGGDIKQGAGSRVGVLLNERAYVFHEPHPGNVLKKAVVESVREFLISAEIEL